MNEKPRFEILEQIGHGQFSNVFKARWINAPIEPTHVTAPVPPAIERPIVRPGAASQPTSGAAMQLNENRQHGERYVALKRIKFYDIQDSKLRMDCVKEVKLLQQLRHPNIINYNISFIERNELFIVLELADGGDLLKLIKYFKRRKQLLSEQIILKYFIQICSAVEYIHSRRILHRDIKPANIFMTSQGRVKLGDFGLSRFFSQNTHDVFSIVGTLYYMSPERICKSGYSFSSDIWSLGCVLYELITLNSPFSVVACEHQASQVPAQQAARAAQQPDSATGNGFSCLSAAAGSTLASKRRPASVQQAQPVGQPAPHPPPAPTPSATPSSSTFKHPTQRQESHHENHQPRDSYNLQWLIERIVRAEYPSLNAYTSVSAQIRQLTIECLNPDPEVRPNMTYICAVVGEAHQIQERLAKQNSSLKMNPSKASVLACRQ